MVPVTAGAPLQIESGFFHESDVKIVAKSIRDRVALIQWRRERIWPVLQPQERQDPGSPDTVRAPPAPLQVQVTYHTQAVPPEPEEPEADQHLLAPALPASATSLACECCSPHPPALLWVWGGAPGSSLVLHRALCQLPWPGGHRRAGLQSLRASPWVYQLRRLLTLEGTGRQHGAQGSAPGDVCSDRASEGRRAEGEWPCCVTFVLTSVCAQVTCLLVANLETMCSRWGWVCSCLAPPQTFGPEQLLPALPSVPTPPLWPRQGSLPVRPEELGGAGSAVGCS